LADFAKAAALTPTLSRWRERWFACALLLLSCTIPNENSALSKNGSVTGAVSSPAGGDVWLFLYKPNEGPPGPPVQPVAVSAISSARFTTIQQFTFANVEPNPYRLYALQDTDGNFDGNFDVLSQPTSGDRTANGVAFQSQPGRGASVDIALTNPVTVDPPAFTIVGEEDLDVILDPAAVSPMTLKASAVGVFDADRIGFTFGLVDTDNNQIPDDTDGDGVPDISLQLFLRWMPLPGQLDDGSNLIVPLAFDPSPFLLTLQNRLDTTVTATQIQVVMIPQAVVQSPASDGGTQLSTFGTPPAGQYEIIALQAGGQFWRMPNQLSTRDSSQGVRLHIDRSSR